MEYVTCQLRHSGILEAIHIRKEGYPVRLPFQNFLARYSGVLARDSPATQSLDELVSTLWFVLLWGLQLQPWLLLYQHLIFQVWPPGWAKAQLLGEERRLHGRAVSCGGKPLRSLSDWSNKGDTYREPILIAQTQSSIHWLSMDREQLGSLPKEGEHCVPSPSFCFASCLKYQGGIFSISDKETVDMAPGCCSSMASSFVYPAFLDGDLGFCLSCLLNFITPWFPVLHKCIHLCHLLLCFLPIPIKGVWFL